MEVEYELNVNVFQYMLHEARTVVLHFHIIIIYIYIYSAWFLGGYCMHVYNCTCCNYTIICTYSCVYK